MSGAGYSNILSKQHGGGQWAAGYRISSPEIKRVGLVGELKEEEK